MSLSLSKTGSKPGLVESGIALRAAYISAFLIPLIAVAMLPFLAIPIVFILVVRFGAVRAVNSKAFGSARFAEFHDLNNVGMLGSSGLILGRVFGKRASLYHAVKRLFTAPLAESREVCTYLRYAIRGKPGPETHLVRLRKGIHGMVCAPPGAGKGVGFVIPNLLSYPGSVVAIDPKGELFTATARVRRKLLNNRVLRLDPLDVCGPGGARLNPLLHVDPASPLLGDQATAIAEALVVRTGRESEDHWNDSAQLGITGALIYVIVYACPQDRNLNAVADLLTDADAFAGMVAMMRDVSGDLESVCGHTHAYKLLRRYGNTMASWEERELSSIRSSIGRHMSWLHSPLVENHLLASDFDPKDLVQDNVTVYLVLPPKYLSTLSRLLRLWVTTLYGSITECGEQQDREILFMLDEVGSLGASLPSLYSAITLGRGYGLRVWLILQSISQLKTIFPKDGEHQTVEASMDHKMFFGVRDFATAEMVSNYSGTTTISVTSHTTSRGSTTSGGSIFSSEKYSRSTNEGTSETRSETGRKLLMPDEIIQLPPDLAVILSKGVPPILAGLAKYYESPELAFAWPYVGRAKKEVRAIA
jgi:type IV secretion system protein VirD4